MNDADVSIVICCHGQHDLTAACLRAIRDAADPALLEIILVDDASSELLVPDMDPGAPIILIRHDQSLGFLCSANAGAARASGTFLFFLNNDTQPQPGFLTHAQRLFDEHADAGFVGCKLIYPDGRLQEAGVDWFPDGTTRMIGYGESPDDDRHNHVCPSQYVSGAALMMRRTTFEELNGFDTAFAPAYYEDVDLQLRARRALGLRTYYQPLSVIVHERGATYGKDVDSTAMQLVDRNRALLLKRHGPLPDTADSRPPVHVLAVGCPAPDSAAGRYLLATSLAARVTIVPLQRPVSPDAITTYGQNGVRVMQDRDGRPLDIPAYLARDHETKPLARVTLDTGHPSDVPLHLDELWPERERLLHENNELRMAREALWRETAQLRQHVSGLEQLCDVLTADRDHARSVIAQQQSQLDRDIVKSAIRVSEHRLWRCPPLNRFLRRALKWWNG